MPLLGYYLGRAPYKETWELQERLRQSVHEGGPEVLLFCEHLPVLTLGRSASTDDILADAQALSLDGIECVRSSRGGKVTYHGPGQLVVYPIVRLRRGLVAHIEWLAAAAVDLAAEFAVHAEYRRDSIGVFVGARKLAAIGVNVSRRVAIHGLALNITREATSVFERGFFVPCGQKEGQAVSLEEAQKSAAHRPLPCALEPKSLAKPLAEALCRRAGWETPEIKTAWPPLLSKNPLVK